LEFRKKLKIGKPRAESPDIIGIIPMQKAERLLSIILMLLNKERISCSFLAKHFGVSPRTIYRDLESLSLCGVPLLSEPGRNGGIWLMEGYHLDRAILHPEELTQILSNLDSLCRATNDPGLEKSLEKFRSLVNKDCSLKKHRHQNLPIQIEIDPPPWLKDTIDLIRKASSQNRLLRIEYVDGQGLSTQRDLEPYVLIYQWSSWYIWAWCRLRKAYRSFKLLRIRKIDLLNQRFDSREPDLESRPWAQYWEDEAPKEILLRFEPSARSLVLESFPAAAIQDEENGYMQVKTWMPLNAWTIHWIGGFGIQVEVLEPQELRQELMQQAKLLIKKYSKP